jgi:hypothetical protein
MDSVTDAALRGTREYDPRVDRTIHANASNLGAARIDIYAEAVLITAPGPEGTTIKLWTYWPDRTSGCIGVVDSVTSLGQSTVDQDIRCGTTLMNGDVLRDAPAATPGQEILAGSSGTWTASSGHDYTLIWERDLPDVRRVTLVFADRTTRLVSTVGGFWIGYLNPTQAKHYTEVYSGRDGNILGTRTFDFP